MVKVYKQNCDFVLPCGYTEGQNHILLILSFLFLCNLDLVYLNALLRKYNIEEKVSLSLSFSNNVSFDTI